MIAADHPLVSVCLPVLNGARFLEQRLQSIYSQTYPHWELVAVDNFSDDGTWEHLQREAKREPRLRISQAPKEGMYANWNNTLQLAQGEWLYVATADDTMDPRCLEVLVGLAQKGPPHCIAQCGLTLIDDRGESLASNRQWPHNTEWQAVLGGQFEVAHERPAPFDGAAVMLFGNLITSITQALFPREAFVRFGGFPNQFGSAGDMAWNGLLGFFYHVKYTPERLATWRFHDAQATASVSSGYYERQMAITDWMLDTLDTFDAELGRRVRKAGLQEYNRFARLRHEAAGKSTVGQRASTILRLACAVPRFYRKYLAARLRRRQGRGHDATVLARMAMLEQFFNVSADRLLSHRQATPNSNIIEGLAHQNC
jgi:glycosyltransferase involved in cell wall biosynthesis